MEFARCSHKILQINYADADVGRSFVFENKFKMKIVKCCFSNTSILPRTSSVEDGTTIKAYYIQKIFLNKQINFTAMSIC